MSSSVWVELVCHRVPPRSPVEAVVGRGLLTVGELVLIGSGTVGVVSVLGLDAVGRMGFKGPRSDVGGLFPLKTVPLLGFRNLRLDGHCWRPHRARLLGFLVTSQGSSWFLAHVTLRVRTPPPQETEHWKRETAVSPRRKSHVSPARAGSEPGRPSRNNCAAEICTLYICILYFCTPLVPHGNMHLLETC